MTTAWMDVAAGRGALGIGLLAAGVVIVALLIGAFWMGAKVRRREPTPPSPEQQPQVPDEGPVREVMEDREPDEVPRTDRRLTPHELPGHGNAPTRSSASKQRPRWDEGSSGAFGSGGSGGR